MATGTSRRMMLLFSVVFMDMTGFGFIIPMLPDYVLRFGGTPSLVGLLTSTYAVGQFLAAPLLGRLSDRHGRKPILLVSVAGTALAMVVLGLASALPMLFVARLIDGVTGGNVTVAQSYIADITDDDDRARGLGLIGAAFGLGFIFGPLFGGLLSAFGIAAPAFASAGIACLNLALIAFVLPESLAGERSRAPRRRLSARLLLDTLRTEGVGTVLAATFFYALAFIMFETVFALFARERLGLTPRTRGFVLAYVGVLVAAVQGGGIGVLTSRFSERSLLVAGAAVLALSLGVWAFSSSLLYLLLVLIPLSVSAGVVAPVLRSLLSKSVPREEVGGVMGLSASIESFDRIMAPSIGAALLGHVGTWASGVAAAALTAGVTLFAWLNRRRLPR